jgi:hypothetical protein
MVWTSSRGRAVEEGTLTTLARSTADCVARVETVRSAAAEVGETLAALSGCFDAVLACPDRVEANRFRDNEDRLSTAERDTAAFLLVVQRTGERVVVLLPFAELCPELFTVGDLLERPDPFVLTPEPDRFVRRRTDIDP